MPTATTRATIEMFYAAPTSGRRDAVRTTLTDDCT